jgi:hypothetical protein
MLDKDTLYNLYVTENLTTVEIAALVGVNSSQTISNWLRKYDIPIRDRHLAQRPVASSKEQLHELYVNQELSIDTIWRQLGSSESSISKLLHEYEIPIRDKTEKCAGWNKGIPLSAQRKQELSDYAKSRIGENSPRYGAKLADTTRKKISSSLKGKYRQHLHPNWKNGGITKYRAIIHGQFEYKDWRKSVYERDNYTCQMCNKPSNGDIQAHHIHPVRECPERILDITNGITLCVSCHRSIWGKEAQYIDRFEKLIHVHPPN